MTRITLTTIVTLFVVALTAQTNILYVTPNGTGNGNSWEDASSDLNAILFKAEAGTQVWVAQGTYLPTTDTDRTISFHIPTGVAVYGGFNGTETNLNQRDIEANTTILSGNIGEATAEDNAYNVVYFENATPETILDGFTIQDGTGNGVGTTGERNRCGAGIYNYGAGHGSKSDPTVANCTLKNNHSRDGGAVYNNAITGIANPTFLNCEFYGNKADLDGGAIFNDGRKGGICNPTFIDCIIKGNQANYGGGVCNYAGKGESSPVFDNCQIANNEAQIRGGGIYNMDIEGTCEPVMKHCRFTENTASSGETMYTFSTDAQTSTPVGRGVLAKNYSN